jgi:hypothetical protein
VWTEEDVAKLRAAIVALASGQAVISVSYAGPPARTVTYAQADLDKMRALLAEMNRQVTAAPHYRRVRWSRGFHE